MKILLLILAAVGCCLAQTTVTCQQPVTVSCANTVSLKPNTDGTSTISCPANYSLTCTVATVTPVPPVTTNPIVQTATCKVSYGQNCTFHLASAPKVGNKLVLFGSSTYPTPFMLPTGFTADLSLSSPGDVIATAAVVNGTQDFVLGTGTQAYAKGVLAEVQGIGAVDVSTPSITKDGTVNMTTTANDVVFVTNHGFYSADISADAALTHVASVQDPINEYIVSYKSLTAGSFTSKATSASATQLIVSTGIAYKTQ